MMHAARTWWRVLLGVAPCVAMLGGGAARATDHFEINLRDLDGKPLPGVRLEAWEQLESSVQDFDRTTNLRAETVSLGTNLVRVGAAVVPVDQKLRDAVTDKDGVIKMTINTAPSRRAIVFIANRTDTNVATAMVPFLVDATEVVLKDGEPVLKDGQPVLQDVERTHVLYIAVPRPIVTPAPQAPSKFAPAVPSKWAPLAGSPAPPAAITLAPPAPAVNPVTGGRTEG
jgi:hypothetical protein